MSDADRLKKEIEELKRELAKLEEGSLAWKMVSDQIAERTARLIGDGAIAEGDGAKAVGKSGLLAEGGISNSTVVIAGDGAKVVIGDQPVEMKPELRNKALGRYLEHVIAHNRYLQLQGIRSGGKLVNIELEHIYITLRTTQQRTLQAEEEWLKHEAEFAPGEMRKFAGERTAAETVNVRVEQALAAHKHIVVLGDPGSGKTTLMRYLALLYGRDLAEGTSILKGKLILDEAGMLPILLQMRQIGAFLKAHRPKDDGTEGHGLLLDFLLQSLKNHKLEIPRDFFDDYLENGKAVLLLDGMDEVADPDLRARVARLVEAFTLAYPQCRFVVTSRIVGYSGAARLQADYVTTTVQDFTLEDIRQFLSHWHGLVAIGQMGAGEDAENYAKSQTGQLIQSIQANERVRDLAINPLMLTVIALVHRDRVKLPDRRAELYAEAVDVLLGKWDEARGVDEVKILENRPFDAGDRRLLLQNIALHMHEREKKELEAAELRGILQTAFKGMTPDDASARRASERFLTVIEERTGLLSARGEGVYAFSHLTFQEYLAALAIAARDDYVDYILKNSGEAWWREVILLTAGFLSTQSKERTTKLVKGIAENKKEPALYHNLVLASECIRDVGSNRLAPEVEEYTKSQLRKALDIPQVNISPSWFDRKFRGVKEINWIERRAQAIETLVKAGAGYWYAPHGEPEWVKIPAGKFWMGEDSKAHQVELPEYRISRVPITNAQYALFVKATERETPDHWQDGRVPKGLESHPVVNVTWYDALAYCEWLSKMTGKPITLPSEAEWEKAARGDKDKRAYPWGDEFDSSKCNTSELGLRDTTPVGIFLEGASPYGVLDMSGNVWEWTRSNYETRKDDLNSSDARGLRGGSFFNQSDLARCAYRYGNFPDLRGRHYGFRVVVSSRSEA
jgi:formylglycine-generating enzyme required for sulfatase activity/energy-coupling factor transporter ATP-binding protein EcfA2